ncbi:SH3 domain-containing protein [Shimia sp.]|uniref:SH3 domain-containing protein n=1 Tax=Shimia sp. TaxID=1954381 RepID=UPI00329922E0
MIRFLSLLFVLCASIGRADSFPALFDVTGVASDDVLNVRSDASGASDIIGTLSHQQADVEIIAINDTGTWGQVNAGERSGWVSMRFLKRQIDNPDYLLARGFACFGTEPFWSLDVTQGQQAQFSEMAEPDTQHPAGLMFRSHNHPGRYAIRFAESSAVLSQEACNDGMSDRDYGLAVDVLYHNEGETALLSGCCSLTSY